MTPVLYLRQSDQIMDILADDIDETRSISEQNAANASARGLMLSARLNMRYCMGVQRRILTSLPASKISNSC